MVKVLVVEDEPILALELKEDLTELGFEVADVISDGDSILSSVVRNKPDAIVMDIKLFGFRDGIEAANQIRGFYKNTPIIYLSSYPETEVSERIKKTHPSYYLQKPYDPQTLNQALIHALAGKV